MSNLDAVRARNLAYWDGTAPGWVRHADTQDRLGRPLGAAAIEHLAVAPGERVVDIGCGCGGTTAEIAASVQPGGRAVGIDVSDTMVEAARRRFPDVEFHVADAEMSRTLPGAPYDAAFSRMVLMLLADPIAGCATVRRSMRPGGRLAATFFRDPGSTPWLSAVLLGAAAHLGALPPMPVGDEPGPFAFADAGRVETVLGAAGFVDVALEPVDTAMVTDGAAEGVVEWLVEVGPAGAAYREADADARAAARRGAATLLAPYAESGGGYRLPTGIWLLTARAPR